MLLYGRGFRRKNKKKTEVVLTISGRNVNNMQRSMGIRSSVIMEVRMNPQKQLVNSVEK